jgi:hypothetical protein
MLRNTQELDVNTGSLEAIAALSQNSVITRLSSRVSQNYQIVLA